jgi:hypothetical protein
MPRLKWLVLDANSVIILHELGIWSKVTETCDVHLARTVVEEAAFFGTDSDPQPIDLCGDVREGRVRVFDVCLEKIAVSGRCDTLGLHYNLEEFSGIFSRSDSILL